MNLKLKKELESFYDENVWDKETLGYALEHWGYLYANKIAVVDGEKRVSYKDLNSKAKEYANGLLKCGFKKGDRVVLHLPNCLEFIIISFALFKIGVIPIMSLPAHRKTELKGIIEKSGAIGYIAKEQYLGFSYERMIKETLTEIDNEVIVFIIRQEQDNSNLFNLSEGQNFNIVDLIDYKSIALLLLSGGTTGIPKLIPRRHCDYLYVAKCISKKCEMKEDSVYLAALPMAHNFPLGCPGVIGTLMSGGKLVICPNTSPDEIVPLIEKEKVTITGLVPAVARMCIEFMEMDDSYDISSLKTIQIGGSVLDDSLAIKIENSFNCKLQQVFGIAEGLICCTEIYDESDVTYRTQGKPISEHDEVLIVDEDGEEVMDGEYGELIVRGPYTIYGYYNSDEINKSCISDHCYFRTGDKARKLIDGNYQVVGRVTELINRAGEKIMPSELENILCEHDLIEDVQVVGISDEVLGEKIGVFILKNEIELKLNEIRTFLLKKGVAHFKLPDCIKYIDSWPLTSVGKIDKKKLKNIK